MNFGLYRSLLWLTLDNALDLSLGFLQILSLDSRVLVIWNLVVLGPLQSQVLPVGMLLQGHC